MSWRVVYILTVLLGLSLVGCVDREMVITSRPAGALVFVSDVEVGRTPVTLPFTWYGDYDIILRRSGFQAVATHAQINPPIYEIPPFDLLSEIAPWTYHDRRYLHYEMEKLVLPEEDELLQRAEALREKNLQSVER